MSLISVHNVSFTYPSGNVPVFDQISFSFDTDWKTGLIGRNGKGKTTLFALLQVKEDVLYQPFDTLSYGEQTKVMLAGLFLTHHDYLLIDEPTNHLDASGREILSAYLRKQKTGYMIVSHDRAFLDQCTDHTISLNRTDISITAGSFPRGISNTLSKHDHSFRKITSFLKISSVCMHLPFRLINGRRQLRKQKKEQELQGSDRIREESDIRPQR